MLRMVSYSHRPQPYILLSATILADAGYFGERLAAARTEIVHAWKTRSSN